MLTILLFTLLTASLTNATGLLDIRLKSAHDQLATIVLSTDDDPKYLVLPMKLVKNEEFKFEDLLVNFNKTYNVSIELNETEELGLTKSVYSGTIEPVLGSMSPLKVNLPLSGILLSFKCEKNWSGEKCDEHCDGNCSDSEAVKTRDVQFEVDYTVNPHKMEAIVKMLKKENEISNVFNMEKREEATLLEEIMDRESSGEKP